MDDEDVLVGIENSVQRNDRTGFLLLGLAEYDIDNSHVD